MRAARRSWQAGGARWRQAPRCSGRPAAGRRSVPVQHSLQSIYSFHTDSITGSAANRREKAPEGVRGWLCESGSRLMLHGRRWAGRCPVSVSASPAVHDCGCCNRRCRHTQRSALSARRFALRAEGAARTRCQAGVGGHTSAHGTPAGTRPASLVDVAAVGDCVIKRVHCHTLGGAAVCWRAGVGEVTQGA